MADEWMKVDVTLPDNKKIAFLMGLLGVAHPAPIVGWLICLWSWARRSKSDGHIVVNDHLIQSVCGCTLDRDAFVAAMCHEQVGLLEDCGNGTYWIHDWDDHQKRWLEIQQQNAERQRKRREALKRDQLNTTPSAAADDQSMSRVTSVTVTQSVTHQEGEEERDDDVSNKSSSGVLGGVTQPSRVTSRWKECLNALENLMPGSLRQEHTQQLQDFIADFGEDAVLDTLKDMRARGISRSGVFPYLRQALKSRAGDAAKQKPSAPVNAAFAAAQAEAARYEELVSGKS